MTKGPLKEVVPEQESIIGRPDQSGRQAGNQSNTLFAGCYLIAGTSDFQLPGRVLPAFCRKYATVQVLGSVCPFLTIRDT